MINFEYYTPTKYIFGKGTECATGEKAKACGMNKVLIVYGKGSALRSGLLNRVEASLDTAGIGFLTLGGVKPNPEDDLVEEGIAICRREHVDGLIAVGGGSVIDTAKAIAVGVPYSGDFRDFWAGSATVAAALPVGAVLTIPAAGSEGSNSIVITIREGLIKKSLRTDLARPKFAILNPELTFTLPPYQTAAGISDMLAHVMERYFSPTEDVEITDRLCEGVMSAIIEEAPKVMARPLDYQARANIMWSGTMAHNGICGCGRCEDWYSHWMEHEISALYGVTHGAGLSVVFSAYLAYMAEHKPVKVAQLARRVFGVDTVDNTEAAHKGVRRMREFYASIGMPLTFRQLGVDNPDLELLAGRLHKLYGDTVCNYLPLRQPDTLEIYRMML